MFTNVLNDMLIVMCMLQCVVIPVTCSRLWSTCYHDSLLHYGIVLLGLHTDCSNKIFACLS